MTDRELRVYSLGRASAREAAPVGVRPADNAAPIADNDVTIEVWIPRAESGKPRTTGYAPLPWMLVAAGAGLIAASLILLTRRR